jgi:hypothetical protein
MMDRSLKSFGRFVAKKSKAFWKRVWFGDEVRRDMEETRRLKREKRLKIKEETRRIQLENFERERRTHEQIGRALPDDGTRTSYKREANLDIARRMTNRNGHRSKLQPVIDVRATKVPVPELPAAQKSGELEIGPQLEGQTKFQPTTAADSGGNSESERDREDSARHRTVPKSDDEVVGEKVRRPRGTSSRQKRPP